MFQSSTFPTTAAGWNEHQGTGKAPERRCVAPAEAMQTAGQVANEYAAASAFDDYLSRKAENTVRAQAADLQTFSDFLSQVHNGAYMVQSTELQHDPAAWAGITWGLIEAFRNWQVNEGAAIRR